MDELRPERQVTLSIREVSRRSGVAASALRYYEEQGLIQPLTRSGAATRQYDARVLAALEVITLLREAGFGISDIRNFMHLKRPEDPPELRFERLLQELARLRSVLAERRAAVERAEELLQGWEEEITAARQ